jgi:hypothetical protein
VSWENTLYGYNFAGAGDADQVFLMPPDPRDWLPPQHLAWAVRRAVRELELAPFLAACRADGQGNTAYYPRMMVALVLYCYCKGIRSSRAVEMAVAVQGARSAGISAGPASFLNCDDGQGVAPWGHRR